MTISSVQQTQKSILFTAPVNGHRGENSVGNQVDTILSVIEDQPNHPQQVGITLTLGGENASNVSAMVANYLGAHQSDFPTLSLDTFV